jgi:NADH dehydrogenase [ubiquinone] 1 alpha subcomplex assembly factor 7
MSLKDDIIARIRTDGPMRIDDYMATCLLHPTKGYYTTRQPFGADGDFTTAPEISQMFGELIGLSIAQSWLDQGAPKPFTLAELGPGRGTLMADALRACKAVPGFCDAAQIMLVEASPALQAVQCEILKGRKVIHLATTDALPDQPLFLIANEFFDALPIRQFIRNGENWHERQVGIENDQLCIGLGPAMGQPALQHRMLDTKEGDLIETVSGFTATLAPIVRCIDQHGGVALIIDYGDWRTLGDTLQAVQNHTTVDLITAPGLSDITAHVDFEALSLAAAPCGFSRVTPQGVFLERLGITERAQKLAQNLIGEARNSHIAAHRRLTHPAEMGNLFKVLGLYPTKGAPPPGLEP